jgi:hypothetical protein
MDMRSSVVLNTLIQNVGVDTVFDWVGRLEDIRKLHCVY